jgi:uncharacterized protein (DUF2062 family)
MGRVGDWLGRKVRDPLVAELRQGATPEGLGTSIAVGAAIGVLPFLGTTTVLCALAGRLFRLNHVALQVTNYLLYPAQIALIVPFVRLGETLLGAEAMPIDPATVVASFTESPAAFLAKFGMAGVHAFLAWALVVPAAALLLRRLLLPSLRKLASLTQ